MTREELKALGLDDAQIEEVFKLHGTAMSKEVEKTTLATQKADDLEKQLEERDEDIAELKKSAADNKELTTKYEELEQKYNQDTKDLQSKLETTRLNSALDSAIAKAGGRNAKAIKALLNMDNIKLKDDGTLEGLNLDGLKESDAYLFEVKETVDEGAGFEGGSGSAQGAISQEVFRKNINNVAWMQANLDAVTQGLADGTLKKG